MYAFAAPLVLGARTASASNSVLQCYRRSLPRASFSGTRRYRSDPNARDDDRRRPFKSNDDRVEYARDGQWDRQSSGKRRSLLNSNDEEWKGRGNDRGRRGGRRESSSVERGRSFDERRGGRQNYRFRERARGSESSFDERRGGQRETRFEERERGSRNFNRRHDYRSENDTRRERSVDRHREPRFYDDRQDTRYGADRREPDLDRRQEVTQFEENRRPWDSERRHERVEEPSEVQKALASGDDLVYGLQSVKQALFAGRRNLHTLYLQNTPGGSGGERKADNQRMRREIERTAHSTSLRVVLLDRGELNALSSNRPHQGVVLRCDALQYQPDTTTLDAPKTGDVLLALDEVQDPQNVGALLRSAAFLGARGVVVCERNSAPLTPVVSRASAGAAECVEVTATDSMPRFLRRARDMGWRVLGAASGTDSVDIGDIEKGPPTILVLGSEGDGLRTMVRNCCDNWVEISRSVDAPEALDSLNVSVAGALALFTLLR